MHILVTAGPTREPIDPVRFISNRSTGKMGYALAAAAVRRGHTVTLVSGPVSLTPPAGAAVVPVVTAEEMCAAVLHALPACDALIMAAAVADWRPRTVAARKLKKRDMQPTLELERTPDILIAVRAVRRDDQTIVGFAAETGDPEAEARRKLIDKGLDLIVANDISEPGSGFGTDTNRVTLITDADRERLPLQSKDDAADAVIVRVERLSEYRRRRVGSTHARVT